MGFRIRSRGNTIEHLDVNQYAEYLTGTREEVATRAGNSAVSYADTLRQTDTTNGRILRLQYGTSGAPTTVLEVNKTTVYAQNFAMKGRAIYDVRAYGALGDGSDQTTAILAARSDILTAFASGAGGVSAGYAAVLQFGPGAYRMNDTLVFQSVYGVTIRGHGPNNSVLYTVDRGDDWAGKHQIDFANSSNCSIEHMDIRNDQHAPGSGGNMPDTGVFWAQGTGVGSNANRISNVRIEGAYKYACFYAFGVPSSSANELDCYLRSDAALANDTVNTACVILTATNGLGLTASNGLTLLSGFTYMSDIAFSQCELHDLVAPDRLQTTSTTSAMWLDEAYEISYRDGNMSSSGAMYVRLSGRPTGVGGRGCRNIEFRKVTFYNEIPSGAVANVAPLIGIGMTTGIGTTPSLVVENLTIDGGCYINLRGANAAAAILHGVVNSEFKHPVLRNWRESDDASFIGSAVVLAGGTLSDPDIDCRGFPVNVGAGAITRGDRLHQGTSTMAASSESHGQFMLRVGGIFSVAASATGFFGEGGSATEAQVQIPVSQACRFRNLRVNTAVAPGGATTLTCTLMKNGVATAMAVVITGAAVTNREIATSINFAEGDLLSLRVVALAGTVTTTAIKATLSGWNA